MFALLNLAASRLLATRAARTNRCAGTTGCCSTTRLRGLPRSSRPRRFHVLRGRRFMSWRRLDVVPRVEPFTRARRIILRESGARNGSGGKKCIEDYIRFHSMLQKNPVEERAPYDERPLRFGTREPADGQAAKNGENDALEVNASASSALACSGYSTVSLRLHFSGSATVCPAPKSAPVVGSRLVSDAVRAAIALRTFASAPDTFTVASPSPPSTAG